MSSKKRTGRSAVGASRRKFLVGAGGIAAASAVSGPLILVSGKARAAGKIVVATYGGSYADALNDVYFKPFTAETGVEVVVSPPVDLAKLKAQVSMKTVEADIIEYLPTEIITASREGLIEPIDYSIVQMPELIYPDAKKPNWASVLTYTIGIGYDTSRHGAGKYPKTWAEFWDVKKFPGRRGLRSRPNDTLEAALLADGVDPKKLYPLDVDRAFKKLDEIKPHITKWVDTASQTVSLVQQNEIDFSNTYSGRVYAANLAGIPLGYPSDQLMIALNSFSVPKGAANKNDAMKLLNSMMSKPDRQAKFFEKIAYGPTTKKGYEACDPKLRAAWLPDMSNPKHVVVNPEWWGEPGRFEQLTARFKQWLIA
jgi:putative spermidine/putrescine transport system substrate-binding protein